MRAGSMARSALELYGLSPGFHAMDVPRRVRASVRRPAVRPVLRSLRRSLHGRDASRELLHARQRLRARAGAEMIRASFLVILLLLVACAEPHWVRQDANAEQADQDDIDCQRQAAREASLRAGGFYGPSYYGPYRWPVGRSAASRPDTGFDPYGYRTLDEAR